MVPDGKENKRPNLLKSHETNNGVKQSNLSNNKTQSTRPLLFSEILFNNDNSKNNGKYFSTTCTSPVPDSTSLR